MAKSTKTSSPKTSTSRRSKSKTNTSVAKDVVDAEIVPDEAVPADSDVVSKADTLPEIEPSEDKEPVEQEPETPAEPEPETTEKAAQPPAQAAASGGLFGSVLGGVIAGALGFGAAMLIFPDGWRTQDDSALMALESTVQEQSAAIEAASTSIEATKEALSTEIAALSEADVALSAGIDGLNTRLEELTQGDGTTKLPDDVQILLNAQKEEIAKLQATVAGMAEDAKAQMQAAAAQQETAEQAEARVKARGAAQQIRLALLSGEPFADALEVVAPAVEIPAGLAAVAEEGAPTSADVSDAFPAAARAALSKAVRETAGDDTQSRLKLFLQDQLSARSLSPQEGDSADAVLSRAEAAVKAEDYQTALTEIDALPESAQAELADWRAQAEARHSAVDAFTAVTDALNNN